MKFARALAASIMAATIVSPVGARAGLYWESGVHSKVISVCFVGDAITSRPLRVQQVLLYIREYGYAANVKFAVAPATCAAPTIRPDGTNDFDGDIRVVIPSTSEPGTGLVPGVGCTSFRDAMGNYNGGNDGWGSWSGPPNAVAANHACLYNLKLGDDGAGGIPYLNHTLHEFGHALGLAHEFERSDVDRTLGCTESSYGGSATSFLTRFDRLSVMNYKFTSCGINGNYDYTGLSDLDRLSVHILYPEDVAVAEFVGTTVVSSAGRIVLQSGWGVRGADLGFTANTFEWEVAGTVRSMGPILDIQLPDIQLPEGSYGLRFSHGDFLGRAYSYTGIIRVLNPTAYSTQAAAVAAAQLPLL